MRARPKAAARRAAAWKQVSKAKKLRGAGRTGRCAARRAMHRGSMANVQYDAHVYGMSPSSIQSWPRATGGTFAAAV
eukprot:426626-Pyramimonas_sp.AAC.1